MWFMDYKNAYLKSESQVDTSANNEPLFTTFFSKAAKAGTPDDPTLFEIEDFSFDIEQTLNIGSQSTGAGAGKVTFNPFSITRKIDRSSPILFKLACSGTPFQEVALGLRKSSGGDVSGQIYLVFRFKLVAVKTISWSYDDESPKETVTFEYGGLQVHYSQQQPNGSMKTPIPGGWNRVRNVSDEGNTLIQ
jgi:type VI secretion system Hcp family effector